MCTQDGNTNKGCCIPPDTDIGIFSLPGHPGYILRWTTPPWAHPLWFDDLHLSGAYLCFNTQGELFCFPKPYFFKTRAHHIRRIIYQNLQ